MKKVIKMMLISLTTLIVSCKNKDSLMGNWQVIKMEPKNKDIKLETLLALGLAKEQTIDQIHFDKDSVIFLNSKNEILLSCNYSYDEKTSKILLNKFPLENMFTKVKNRDSLNLIVGEFYYVFAKK